MTEQEIVDVLIENKRKGIAYMFMSEDVRDWVTENANNPYLLYLDPMGNWKYFKYADFDDCDNVVFTLSDDYELPHKPSGEWVEFKINKIGRFTDYNVDDNDHQISFSFGWNQWSEFLEFSYEHGFGYTTFGGWQYRDCDAWFLTPQIAMQGHFYNLCTKNDEPKPAVPIKIRFWREA